jgi:hypothetical protein
MSAPLFRIAPAIAFALLLASASAQTPGATPGATPAPLHLKYKLPAGSSGGATLRQTGGTRAGGSGKLPSLEVLAPDHVALTTQAQPILFWYQSEPAAAKFQLTLTEPKKARPELSVTLEKSEKSGICGISLASQNVTLEPNITYRFSVALIPDPQNRSKDLLANALVKRVEPSAELTAKLKGAPPASQAALYAEAGYWWDALQAISTAIAAEPQNAQLRELRASLLKQAGLSDAVAKP